MGLSIAVFAPGRRRCAAALHAKRPEEKSAAPPLWRGGSDGREVRACYPAASLGTLAANDSALILRCLAGAERCHQLLNQRLIGRAAHL